MDYDSLEVGQGVMQKNSHKRYQNGCIGIVKKKDRFTGLVLVYWYKNRNGGKTDRLGWHRPVNLGAVVLVSGFEENME